MRLAKREKPCTLWMRNSWPTSNTAEKTCWTTYMTLNFKSLFLDTWTYLWDRVDCHEIPIGFALMKARCVFHHYYIHKKHKKTPKGTIPLGVLVRTTGFEPAAYRVGVCHSIQLSYVRKYIYENRKCGSQPFKK